MNVLAVFIFTQTLLAFYLFNAKVTYVIKLSLTYYIVTVTCLPVYLALYEKSSPEILTFTKYLVLNNGVILLCCFLHFLLPKIRHAPLTDNFSISNTSLLFILIVCIEFLLILNGKPHLISAIFNAASLLDARVTLVDYPPPLNYLIGNVSTLEYVAAIGITTFWATQKRVKKLAHIAMFILLSYFILSTLRKGAVIYLGMVLILPTLINQGFRATFRHIYMSFLLGLASPKYRTTLLVSLFLICGLFAIFLNYGATSGTVVAKIMERLLLDAIRHTTFYIELYQPFQCCNPNVLPSTGGSLWGIESHNLEKQLFSDLYPNRADRYGNTPVIGLVAASKAFGLKLGTLATFVCYFITFMLSWHISRIRDRGRRVFTETVIALNFLTLFSDGVFRIFSPFILFSVSVWLAFLLVLSLIHI